MIKIVYIYNNFSNASKTDRVFRSGLTCWNATAKNANSVEGCQGVDLGDTAGVNYGVLAESGGTNKMINGFFIDGEPGFPIIYHHSPISVYPQEVTHVALLRQAMGTLFAFTSEYWEDMVSWCKISHTLPYTLDDPKINNDSKSMNTKLQIMI